MIDTLLPKLKYFFAVMLSGDTHWTPEKINRELAITTDYFIEIFKVCFSPIFCRNDYFCFIEYLLKSLARRVPGFPMTWPVFVGVFKSWASNRLARIVYPKWSLWLVMPLLLHIVYLIYLTCTYITIIFHRYNNWPNNAVE